MNIFTLAAVDEYGSSKRAQILGLIFCQQVRFSVAVLFLQSELLHDVLLRRLIRVEVQPVEDLQGLLGVPVGRIGHPAARLHLVGVQSPELQLLLEEGSADVRRVVELPRPVVVEDLGEDARVSVEEVLVEDGVVVGQGLREAGQPGGRDLLQRRLVRLVADAADVQDDTVLRVRHPTLRRISYSKYAIETECINGMCTVYGILI